VVIGAGVRLPPNRLVVFEAVVNAIYRGAPQAALAFNARPEDSCAAPRAGSDPRPGPLGIGEATAALALRFGSRWSG